MKQPCVDMYGETKRARNSSTIGRHNPTCRSVAFEHREGFG